MKRVWVQIIIIIFLGTTIFCQDQDSIDYSLNLIPNHSFEKHGRIPCNRINVGKYELFNIDSWSWASYASSDIFSTLVDYSCWSHASIMEDALMNRGMILPRSGDIMLGFYTTGYYKGTEYHEYLVSKLNEPLIPGYRYYVEFWVCRCPSTSIASNNIGSLFVKDPVFNTNIESIYGDPQINCERVIHEYKKWTKISGVFTPSDTLNYMIIGNFFPDHQTQVQGTSSHYKNMYFMTDTYYYLDDVYVIPAGEKPEMIEKEKSEFESLKVNEAFILKNIFFDHDKSVLLPASYIELNKLLDFLEKYPSVTVEISGHTDNNGSPEYNIKLSNKRAKAVVEYLTEKGIMKARMKNRGYGEAKPIDTNKTKEGRQNNRRVEFKILKK